MEVGGFYPALMGMRHPMNSWEKSDSVFLPDNNVLIGQNDMKLARNLVNAGSEHSKFLRQIQVWANVNMPRYWWSEMDTYKFGTKNSCSTMHKLFSKDTVITTEQFVYCKEDLDVLKIVVFNLNKLRIEWLRAKEKGDNATANQCLVRAKRLLPEGFLQLRMWNTNYAEILNIYNQREHHRLKEEWQEVFCGWALTLPYFQQLCIRK